MSNLIETCPDCNSELVLEGSISGGTYEVCYSCGFNEPLCEDGACAL